MSKPIFDPPYVGVFLEGFLTNGDWRSILANLLQLVLTIGIYWPFFKIIERQELLQEKAKEKEIFNAEENKLLDDMDLDF